MSPIAKDMHNGMSTLDRELMRAPSLTPGRCVVCDKGAHNVWPQLNAHHVVPRSRGGTDGPILHLCGSGTQGCHGMAEQHRLRFKYEDGLWYFRFWFPVDGGTFGPWHICSGM